MVSVMQAGLWAMSAARAGCGADSHRSRDCWHEEEKAELPAAPGTYSLLEIHVHLTWHRFLLAAAPAWAAGGIKAEPPWLCSEVPQQHVGVMRSHPVGSDDLKDGRQTDLRAQCCAVPGAAFGGRFVCIR